MKKLSLALLLAAATPIIVFSLLCKDNATQNVKKEAIYLHEQQKAKRSNKEHFNSFVNTGDVIVDFYADWCGPCRRMSPIIDDLAAMMPEFTFIKAHWDYFKDVADDFKIDSIPTLIFLRNGKEIGRYNGRSVTKEKLANIIKKNYKN